MPHATLLHFARANDTAASTTKKLQKQAALAEYFKTLSETDLRLALRFAAGRSFPANTETILNIGTATLRDIALSLLNISPHDLRTTSLRTGDLAEAISNLWPHRRHPPVTLTEPLTLQHIAETFHHLAATSNTDQKRDLLSQLFSQCQDPREAAYLAKFITGDLRTGVQESTLQAALAQSFSQDLKQIQRAQLLLGDLEQVASLALHNTLHEAKFTLFHPIQFMLSTPQDSPTQAATTIASQPTGVVSSADHLPPPPTPFYSEDKLDGIRAQIHKSGPTTHIYTRTLDRADQSFPDVLQQLRHLPGDLLLDGEIVPYANHQVLPFSHLQKRLGRKTLTPKILAQNPCRFIAFDLLYHNGELLIDLPLSERRQRLDSLTRATGDPTMSPPLLTTTITPVTTELEITSSFEAARNRRNEGIILKSPQSPYSPGRRGKSWLKLKTHLPTFDCVVTAAEFGHGKRRNVLSDYTFAVWSSDPTEDPTAQLLNLGKSFTGLTDAEIAQYTPLFLNLSTSNNGRVHQVLPKVVLEIACDQIQKSDRHPSGYALRFPRIKRIRTDKLPHDADRLPRIIELYESQHNFAKTTPPPPEPTLFDHL